MVDFFPLLLAAGVIVLWCLGIYALQRRGVLEPRGLQPSPPPAGPFLMWKTVRGRQLIDRLARPARFWRVFGDIAIVLVAVTMIGTTLLLLWEATLVQSAAIRANPPSPEALLGLPGINPFIPLGYGILGLSVAIILHEFSHGILSRVAKINIRSLGLIFLIFPIGAFVEPDEDELRALPRRQRARLYAVGPATNVLLAVIFASLFSSIMVTSVAPVHDGVGVVGFTNATSPAFVAGMKPYTVITGINGTPVHTDSQFVNALSSVRVNTTIQVQAYDPATGGLTNYTVRPVERNPVTKRAVLGIFAFDVSTDYYHPLTNPARFGGVPQAILAYVSLPLSGYSPIDEPATRFYQLQGPAAVIPAALFWLLVNAMYWLFWLNLMLGATNALPAVPLDGGYIFRDGIEGLVSRLRKGMSAEQKARIGRAVSRAFAFLILGLVLWQLIGPRL
jgi:membrane-associated protease RseP (regulator of RpoE activity)